VFTFTQYKQSLSHFHDADRTYITKNISFLYFFPMFCLGIFAGIIYYHISEANYNLSNRSTGLLCLFFAISHILFLACTSYTLRYLFSLSTGITFILFLLCYVVLCILLSDCSENFFQVPNGNELFHFFGDISYPGYLFHLSLNYFFMTRLDLQPYDNIILFTLITIPDILLLSYILHVTLEKFFIDQ
jgi:peptidoglycan/LPS O-acetylase OafA/YrhL